jgi:hypothetical protein
MLMRRCLAAMVLLAFASMPVVGRTRLFCRYTGVEISSCAEQDAPDGPQIQADGCCLRQVTRPLGNLLSQPQQEIAAPALVVHPEPVTIDGSEASRLVQCARIAAPAPTGPPLFVITRALLI